MPSPRSDTVLDVAIVGGGVAGLYCAYRLLTGGYHDTGGALRVSVYERSPRTGGRLLSVTPPRMPHLKAELGGMRFMSTHKYVNSLIFNKLRLRTRPFPVDEDENIVYLRGQRFRGRDLKTCGVPGGPTLPYNLTWSEKSIDPRHLLTRALDALFPGLGHMSSEAIRARLDKDDVRVDGIQVRDYGLWNLLDKVLSDEAYALARAIGGYDCLTLNYNAVSTAAAALDFTPGAKYYGLVDGYEEVPIRLAKLIVEEGGEVLCNKCLTSVGTKAESGGTLTLNFDDGTHVQADAVILAMPRRSLELLDEVGPAGDDGNNHDFWHDVRSVSGIPLLKVFACYPYPWWEIAGVTEGRSLTDLPIRQCYYCGVEGQQEGADGKSTESLILASYDDGQNSEFWGGYQRRPRGKAAREPWEDYAADPRMSETIHRQLAELHGVKFAPKPSAVFFMDWSKDPFGGGTHLWNIGVKSTAVFDRMLEPFESHRLYICGEAYSKTQTWVEGALETAEAVLQRSFGLSPPEWVS